MISVVSLNLKELFDGFCVLRYLDFGFRTSVNLLKQIAIDLLAVTAQQARRPTASQGQSNTGSGDAPCSMR